MLVLPPGHAEEVQRRRAFSGRERWMIRGVLGVLAVGVVALVISFAVAGKKTSHGCISVALAYSTGGSQIYRCGAGARALCSGVGRAGGITGTPAQALATECRKAGIAVG
ncbi:MAG TPA: hypothetical protein VIK04_19895 [Solirubrobacteraceae bacterium]